MTVKKYKPTSPARRFMNIDSRKDITTDKPYKPLVVSLPYHAGRNNYGRITVRHRGGRHKRKYRIIDFKRDKVGIKAKVLTIEYDPNRSCRIALVEYEDGEKRYIILPAGLNVGDTIESGPEAGINVGNALPLRHIPVGTIIHNVEMVPGKGAKIARSAGSWVQILAKESEFAHLKMPSGEVRLIGLDCYATIGQVGNIEHNSIKLGSAGRKRHLGFRPTVRGTAMNPVDHPLGGGRGKSKGNNQPRSPWGQPAKGFITRKRKPQDKFILKRRPKKKKKV